MPLSNRAEIKAVLDLTTAFQEAIEKRFAENPYLQARALQKMNPADMRRLKELADNVGDKNATSFFENGDEAGLRVSLEVTDRTVDLAERVLGREELAKSLPQGLQNKDAAAYLADHNALHLAALCRYRLSL